MQSASESIDFSAEKVWDATIELDDGERKSHMRQVGYGSYQVKTEEPIYDSLRFGYRYIDTAAYYENEAAVARQVKRAYTELGLKRSDLFISSKMWCTNIGYEKAKAAITQSLTLLEDLEYIDLYFLHFPVNEEIPPEYEHHVQDRNDTWRALEEFYHAGKIR